MIGPDGVVFVPVDTGDPERDAVADPIPFLSEEDQCFFRASGARR